MDKMKKYQRLQSKMERWFWERHRVFSLGHDHGGIYFPVTESCFLNVDAKTDSFPSRPAQFWWTVTLVLQFINPRNTVVDFCTQQTHFVLFYIDIFTKGFFFYSLINEKGTFWYRSSDEFSWKFKSVSQTFPALIKRIRSIKMEIQSVSPQPHVHGKSCEVLVVWKTSLKT